MPVHRVVIAAATAERHHKTRRIQMQSTILSNIPMNSVPVRKSTKTVRGRGLHSRFFLFWFDQLTPRVMKSTNKQSSPPVFYTCRSHPVFSLDCRPCRCRDRVPRNKNAHVLFRYSIDVHPVPVTRKHVRDILSIAIRATNYPRF